MTFVKQHSDHCRKRHVKCDETKPSCTRCVRAGWKCDGYETNPNKPTSNQLVKLPAKSPPLNISSYSLPFRIPGSQKDRQILHYFCTQGSSDISGFLNSKFWSQTILQHSYHEPAVRQALVALSSLHLDFATSDASVVRATALEPLKQHGKAMRMLNRRLVAGGSDAVKAALLCCVLFFCFESGVGNSSAALQHLGQGLGLLSSNLVHSTVEDMDSITDVLARLDLQATMFDDERLPVLMLVSAEERRHGMIKDVDVPYVTLEEAQKSLDRLQNWLMHLIVGTAKYRMTPAADIPLHFRQERDRLIQEYDAWLHKFSPIADKPDQAEHLCGVHTLLLHHRLLHMVLSSRLPDDDTVFTASPNPAAEEVLNYAESILNHHRKRTATAETAKNPRRSLASDTGIIAPLTMVAVKCADDAIHKKAMRLLEMSQRQEGLYDAKTMIHIVQNLDQVKLMRLAASRREGIDEWTPKSLEYWTADIISGAPNELIPRDISTPRTLLHPVNSSSDTSPEALETKSNTQLSAPGASGSATTHRYSYRR